MDKHALWKWLLLLGLTVVSVALIWPPEKQIPLGLDIQGGISFTLAVDPDKVLQSMSEDLENKNIAEDALKARVPAEVRAAREEAVEIIRNRVDRLGVAEPAIYPQGEDRIVVQIPGMGKKDKDRALRMIKSAAVLEFSIVHQDNDKLVARMFDNGLAPEGFVLPSESARQPYFLRNPKVSDEDMDDEFWARVERFRFPDTPADSAHRLMLERKQDASGRIMYIPFFVRIKPEMKGDHVTTSRVDYDQLNRPYVSLSFDSQGARAFGRITSQFAPGGVRNPSPDKQRMLAIVLDGRLYSAPYIREAIHGGHAQITGDFSYEDARELSIVLRSGALKVPLDLVETRMVDPSLGRYAIQSGVTAAIWGSAAVFIFMLLYYRVCGVVANVGLLFNLILLPIGLMLTAGFLGLFTGGAAVVSSKLRLPVMTLPGIAGIALTLGMAVDANVLIYERIREELKAGKRLATAVVAGYDRAFITILDSNLTTIIAAVILFFFGSGPIRGFGITLAAGIIVSMYSALVITRMIFNVITSRSSLKTFNMLSLFKSYNVDFMGKRALAFSLSAAVIILSWGVMIWRGFNPPGSIFSVDFLGGTSLTYSYAQKPESAAVERALDQAGVKSPSVQYQQDVAAGSTNEYIRVRVPAGQGELAAKTIEENFGESTPAKFINQGEDTVGAQIGREVLVGAVKALLLAFVCMIIYVSWRFRFDFALGGIVALVHDVLVSLGVYCALGMQINGTTIAALLTIIGYSINDTIVIFDRIRENQKFARGRGLVEICNMSINQTMGRTILTSLATMMVVLMLLIFGGGAIFDMALILFIGMIAGVYSTVFIATPVMTMFHRDKQEVTAE